MGFEQKKGVVKRTKDYREENALKNQHSDNTQMTTIGHGTATPKLTQGSESNINNKLITFKSYDAKHLSGGDQNE